MKKKIVQYILKFFSKNILKKYNPFIICINGSVGKTSTKEAVKTVLNKYCSRKHCRIRASQGNYNNEIGVPLTIIGAKSPAKSFWGWLKVFLKAISLILIKNAQYPNILILEMGADKKGDIEYLVKFIPCDIGIITNISGVHLEFFGSLNKIAKEKGKMVKYLKKSGFAVLNKDVELVDDLRNKTLAKVLTFGFDEGAHIRASDVSISYKNQKPYGTTFKLLYGGKVMPVFLPKILGYGQIYSALAAGAVGIIHKMNLFDIVKALEKFTPPPGRMCLLKGIKNTLIIDDTYNSSPSSAKAALDVLKDIKLQGNGKKIVVLGDMLELGGVTEKKHTEIGKYVAKIKVDLLITKGEAARDIAKGALKFGMSQEKIFSFSNNEQVGRFLQERISPNDLILVKGSQGMRLEQVVKEVMAYPLKAEKLLTRQGPEWKKSNKKPA